ncbi:MAG: histidine--tRNA ligase [Dehalococcoidales bacterium]|nr:histidine--tRNA ligase [Dehalococcoidales bacterium]
MYQAPRGTADILPQEQPYWRYVEEKAARICQLYGYERIDFPAFEDAGLFHRSVGEGTDVVDKEMYTFEDRGGSQLALVPEGTASVCRAYVQHGLHNLQQPVKLYYFTSVFRYDRPQAGRYRQHHQFGYEAIGDADPALDAEVIDMAWQFYRSLGLTRLSLHLNSIGCKACRPNYLTVLKEYYAKQGGQLCPDCTTRAARNPLRLLDCKKQSCQTIAVAAPKSIDFLCPDCAEHFSRLQKYLGLLSIPFALNHRLVRGLDYYARTVFEIQPEEEGGQSTLGGGGRYDGLIEELGGNPTPAIGMATGMERIIINLKKYDISVPPLSGPRVFLAYLGDESRNEIIKLGSMLRQSGIEVIEAFGSKSLKGQMRHANTLGVRYAVIIGDDEVKNGTAVFRDMASAQQETVSLARLPELLK